MATGPRLVARSPWTANATEVEVGVLWFLLVREETERQGDGDEPHGHQDDDTPLSWYRAAHQRHLIDDVFPGLRKYREAAQPLGARRPSQSAENAQPSEKEKQEDSSSPCDGVPLLASLDAPLLNGPGNHSVANCTTTHGKVRRAADANPPQHSSSPYYLSSGLEFLARRVPHLNAIAAVLMSVTLDFPWFAQLLLLARIFAVITSLAQHRRFRTILQSYADVKWIVKNVSRGVGRRAVGDSSSFGPPLDVDHPAGQEEARQGYYLQHVHECVICLDSLIDEEDATSPSPHFLAAQHGVKMLPCGHIFHGDCLRRWIMKNAKCPMCRKSVAVGAAGAVAAQQGDDNGAAATTPSPVDNTTASGFGLSVTFGTPDEDDDDGNEQAGPQPQEGGGGGAGGQGGHAGGGHHHLSASSSTNAGATGWTANMSPTAAMPTGAFPLLSPTVLGPTTGTSGGTFASLGSLVSALLVANGGGATTTPTTTTTPAATPLQPAMSMAAAMSYVPSRPLAPDQQPTATSAVAPLSRQRPISRLGDSAGYAAFRRRVTGLKRYRERLRAQSSQVPPTRDDDGDDDDGPTTPTTTHKGRRR